ncbi:hypothetical protein FE257_007792 [Aspergillus nanangensis]|uniref:Uncharacterized protein n=1 Tax=Aspergillus nanangensis TaxID=2582783 RepID=A0AAD4CX13_ASPNN|nr:hypothetical protein FE257_007792 [Aspergillus nanangensis]
MFSKLAPTLLTFLLTLQLVTCLPGITWSNSPRSADETRTLMRSIMAEHGTVAMSSDGPLPPAVARRQVDGENCSLSCTRQRVTVTEGQICSAVDAVGPSTAVGARGTYVTISNSELIAGNDINISISGSNHGGLIVIVFDRVTMHANHDININIDNQWLRDGCELWVYIEDTVFTPDNSGDITIASHDVFGQIEN